MCVSRECVCRECVGCECVWVVSVCECDRQRRGEVLGGGKMLHAL